MPIERQWITYEDGETRHLLYAAWPAGPVGALPAVIVLQELWGVNDHIRDVADRFARAGYFAVAPDLFAVNGERPEPLSDERIDTARDFLRRTPGAFSDPAARERGLAELPAEERERIATAAEAMLGLLGQPAESLAKARPAYRFAQQDERCDGRVAAVGFCMGGAVCAALAAAEPELACAVVYYGRLRAESAAAIRCPVLGFFGGQDEGVTSLVPAFAQAMEAGGRSFEYRVYEHAKHAFFNDTGPGYDADASRDAWARTLAFLNGLLPARQ